MTPHSGTGGPKKVWESIRGYFPYTLEEIFRTDHDTVPWREIRATIEAQNNHC